MPTINFVNEKKEIQVPQGANLRKEALNAGVNLYYGFNGIGESINKVLNCHGLGACGSCRVLITKGMENASAVSIMEKVKFRTMLPTPIPDPLPALAYIGNEESMRLACCVTVNGDMTVQTNPELNLFGDNFFS
ncbi:MAG: 2Fe-2S iron-sulfur cluster-binding protein [Planctomycetota bacterium]|nr:2Fe-2S iron-sulfur cluster-binding protein [Planctomycetota bacterium]